MRDKPITMVPDGSSVPLMQQMAEDVVHEIVDHFAGLGQGPVYDRMTEAPHYTGPLTWAETLQVMRDVLRHSMQVAHPRFFGHMDSGPMFVSTLADFIMSAINQNMLSEELSPLATKMEDEVIQWICRLCGYEDAEGALVSGGTMANFTAVLMALHHATKGRFRAEGAWSLPAKPVVFVSDQAHYSVQKAVNACGLGAQSLMKVPSDGQFRMDVDGLASALTRARELGQLPLLVVATAGTTSTGSVDPIQEIADLCERFGVWLHVDAAHGGAALLSAARSKLAGIERVDSIAIDPHKWLMQPKGMGVIGSRHKGLLQQIFQSDAPYLDRHAAPPSASRSAMTFAGSRRFDAFRLWVTRAYLGDEVLGNLIEQNLRQVGIWASLLREIPCFELAHEPDLNVLCFRFRSEGDSDEELDAINDSIQRRLLTSGKGFVSITTLRGRRWLRSVFINPDTTVDDMRIVLEEVRRLGHELAE